MATVADTIDPTPQELLARQIDRENRRPIRPSRSWLEGHQARATLSETLLNQEASCSQLVAVVASASFEGPSSPGGRRTSARRSPSAARAGDPPCRWVRCRLRWPLSCPPVLKQLRTRRAAAAALQRCRARSLVAEPCHHLAAGAHQAPQGARLDPRWRPPLIVPCRSRRGPSK